MSWRTSRWAPAAPSRTPREAYETIIREDKVEAYQAYLVLYPTQSLAPVVRTLVERRREMVAWHDAVTINTVASYRSFLVQYPQSDLTVTANRLIERLRYRPTVAPVVAAAATSGGSPNPAAPNDAPQSGQSSPIAPTNVALGPTCPCSAPSLPIKKIDTPPSKKHGAEPPKRASAQPPRGRGNQVVDEEVVVYGRPPMRGYYAPPPPPVGLGIGIGIGGGRMGGPAGYPNRFRGGY